MTHKNGRYTDNERFVLGKDNRYGININRSFSYSPNNRASSFSTTDGFFKFSATTTTILSWFNLGTALLDPQGEMKINCKKIS